MKIFFFIFGTPFFLAVLYVIRILFGLEYSVEYDEDLVGTTDFVSNLSRRFVIFMMGFLPIALIVQILSYILVYILPYMVYRRNADIEVGKSGKYILGSTLQCIETN